ncbi:MAG: hypothetical protein R3F14_06000 [Polyangiaceae bacterium]
MSFAEADSLLGGTCTAIPFAVGKELLALYLARGGLASVTARRARSSSSSGAYYSSLILFIGAELTQAYGRDRDGPPAHPRADRPLHARGP